MQQTWNWKDILKATGYTDAALRRQEQRGKVKIEAERVSTQVRATLWDVARLRLSRHFNYIGIDPKAAFDLATFIVNLAFGELMKSEKFTVASAKKQSIVFAVFRNSENEAPAPRLIRIDPSERGYRTKAFKELGLVVTDPENSLFPVHWAVLDAWSKLPDLPEDIQAWIAASREKMQGIFA